MTTELPLVKPGVLTIGVDESPPPPMHMGDPGSPDFAGFEVDLTKAVAAELGLSPVYQSRLWSEILPDLLQGRIDMICTAVTISEDRKANFDFSAPYLDVRLVIVTVEPSSVRSLEDLQGRRVGVRVATTAAEFVWRKARAGSIELFDLNTDAYAALREGFIEAVVDDSPIAASFARPGSGLTITATIEGTDSQYALMFAKGKDALREAVDEALAQIKTDGRYRAFFERWFSSDFNLRSISAGPPPITSGRHMIARHWHGETPSSKADAYLEVLNRTGVRDYRATPGNRGVLVLRRVEGDRAHFDVLSFWDSLDSITKFAGEELERARYYPEDDEYLLRKERKVRHSEVVSRV